MALQVWLVGDAVAASKAAGAEAGQAESMVARARGGAHAEAAELFARAGAAVLALAAAAALGGEARRERRGGVWRPARRGAWGGRAEASRASARVGGRTDGGVFYRNA